MAVLALAFLGLSIPRTGWSAPMTLDDCISEVLERNLGIREGEGLGVEPECRVIAEVAGIGTAVLVEQYGIAVHGRADVVATRKGFDGSERGPVFYDADRLLV